MESNPIRVLHVLNNLGTGGAESFLMNVYRKINKNKVQFDFLIRSRSNNHLMSEIENLGGRVFITPEFPKRIFKNYIETKKFFHNHNDYKVIHIHANALLYTLPLKEAKNNKIETIILHSHNTQTANNKIFYKYFHLINREVSLKYASDFFACSKEAGEWMFNGKQFRIINNAIDVESFKYNKNSRNDIRSEFNIHNKLVIGNIGRFTYQKNHNFILEVFNEIRKLRDDAILVLVGEGELQKEIMLKSKKMGLDKSIIFTGTRNDIPKLLSAMDIFLFPSHFEGLGIVLIEAQASGLQCFASKENIPSEVAVSESINFLDLNLSSTQWAEMILSNEAYTRLNNEKKIKNAGYEITELVSSLENYYLSKYL